MIDIKLMISDNNYYINKKGIPERCYQNQKIKCNSICSAYIIETREDRIHIYKKCMNDNIISFNVIKDEE